MLRDRLGQGIWAGIVAAAATAGTLVGFGRVRDEPFALLNAVAASVLGSRALVFDAFDPLVTGTAILVHLAALVLCGIIAALLAGRLRGVAMLVASTAITSLAFAADRFLLPPELRWTPAIVTRGELAIFYAVLALGLALGLLVARPGVAEGR